MEISQKFVAFSKLANHPPPGGFVRPSGVGGVEARWKDDFFALQLCTERLGLLRDNLQKIMMIKG